MKLPNIWLNSGFYSSANPTTCVTPLPVRVGEILSVSKAWTMYMGRTLAFCSVSSLVQGEAFSVHSTHAPQLEKRVRSWIPASI